MFVDAPLIRGTLARKERIVIKKYRELMQEKLFYRFFADTWALYDRCLYLNAKRRTGRTTTQYIAYEVYKEHRVLGNRREHHRLVRIVLNSLVEKGIIKKKRWEYDRSMNYYYIDADLKINMKQLNNAFKF